MSVWGVLCACVCGVCVEWCLCGVWSGVCGGGVCVCVVVCMVCVFVWGFLRVCDMCELCVVRVGCVCVVYEVCVFGVPLCVVFLFVCGVGCVRVYGVCVWVC